MQAANSRNPLQVMERTGVLVAVAATALSGAIWGGAGVRAAGFGAALACVNLWVMRRLVGKALREAEAGHGDAALKRLMALLLFKLPILAALVWVAVKPLGLSVAPFALGLSALVVAIAASGASSVFKEAV
jgi:hypothetical protein